MSAGRARLPRIISAIVGAMGLVLVTGALLVWGTGGFRELPTSFARGVLPISAGMLAAVSYLGAGWLLAARIPRNPIGWLLLAMGLVFAAMTPTALLVDATHRAFRTAPAGTLAAAWLLSTFSAPVLIAAGIVSGLLFPEGRLAGPRWRWAVALPVVGGLALAVATAVRPGGLVWYPTLPNPVAAGPEFRPLDSVAMTTAVLLLMASSALMVVSLVRRYRRGDATVRAQLRWILCAGAALAAVTVPFMIVRFLVPVGDALGEVILAVVDATLALLPIAAAVAITRDRLFGIDVIINRTLVYVPMMAVLGGLYTASIALFQRIFVALTGETSDAPLMLTIFVVAAAFTPVRRALEGVVDRWTRAPGAHGAVPATEPMADPVTTMTPELAETAVRLVALRSLEARMAAGATGRGSGRPRRVAVDAEGRVDCPGGGAPHFVACLQCAHLAGLVTSPPTVQCARPRSRAGGVRRRSAPSARAGRVRTRA